MDAFKEKNKLEYKGQDNNREWCDQKMVCLGDERLCFQWEEQVVTEILTAEDRNLWMKEIYIQTNKKKTTEISNSEWEN